MTGRLTWAARPAVIAAAAGGGVVLAGAAAYLDAVGRLILGTAALVLLALAAWMALLRPRLSADADGVQVRTLTARTPLPWPDLCISARTTRRWGLRVTLLELDTARGPDDIGVLVLLGRWELGAEPADVARELERRRPA